MKDRVLTIRLEADEHMRLKRLAAALGISLNDLIRMSIRLARLDERLAEPRPQTDLARLVGELARIAAGQEGGER